MGLHAELTPRAFPLPLNSCVYLLCYSGQPLRPSFYVPYVVRGCRELVALCWPLHDSSLQQPHAAPADWPYWPYMACKDQGRIGRSCTCEVTCTPPLLSCHHLSHWPAHAR